jgi:glycosyltransferase involved in cell wall biosynthesis
MDADMHKVIAFDIMRLFIGPSFMTPRGIDRVDIALANHIFDDDFSQSVGVLPTPLGVYCYSAKQVRVFLDHIRQLWAEDVDPADDLQLQRLLGEIAQRQDDGPPARPATALLFRHKVWRMLRMVHATGMYPRRLARRAVPANAIYLNIGQLGLAMPSFFNWLAERPDITRAMMIHDAIPIDFPHLVGAKAPMHHRQMVRTAAQHADCMIFNSAYTRDSVSAAMRSLGQDCPPALVRPLPLPEAFLEVETGVVGLSGTRYFVAVSTVEPRKNFALLLRVWQRFVATMGAAAPHLIIAGAPGRDAGSILAPLKSDAVLASRVHHVVGLSSPALASLVLGAAGMLCPSLAEGFGLPLLEASAMGVPAVATDIPAHREVAAPTTLLLPADDEEGWARAIAALPSVPTRQRPAVPLAMTEAGYFADIVEFISGIEGRATYLTAPSTRRNGVKTCPMT